jgi:hypothetical protein
MNLSDSETNQQQTPTRPRTSNGYQQDYASRDPGPMAHHFRADNASVSVISSES